MLNEIISEVEMDDEESAGRKTSGKRGGTRTYNIDGKVVFITQAESFKHRGPNSKRSVHSSLSVLSTSAHPGKSRKDRHHPGRADLVDPRSHWHPLIPCPRTATAHISAQNS